MAIDLSRISPTLLIKPKPRQVLVIAQQGRKIGFCLACRVRSPEGQVVRLVQGIADGTPLPHSQFEASKAETDEYWKRHYPEAEIVHLECPAGMNPLAFARVEAERRVLD